MKLNVSRKIISVIFQLAVAICTAIFLISVVMTFTASDENFFINQFTSQKMAKACDEQLNMKYEALSSETSIPARVFERVEEDYPTDEALRQAALSVFSEENETLYSEVKVSYFYELSIEYLDGNEIPYEKEDIKRAAEKAAKIYSETVGLHNMGGIDSRIAKFSNVFPKLTLASLIIIAACLPSIMVMYKRKKSGYFASISGVFTGAAATAFASILLLIFNMGGSYTILPVVHRSLMLTTTMTEFLIIIFFSLILATGSVSIMRLVDKKIQEDD